MVASQQNRAFESFHFAATGVNKCWFTSIIYFKSEKVDHGWVTVLLDEDQHKKQIISQGDLQHKQTKNPTQQYWRRIATASVGTTGRGKRQDILTTGTIRQRLRLKKEVRLIESLKNLVLMHRASIWRNLSYLQGQIELHPCYDLLKGIGNLETDVVIRVLIMHGELSSVLHPVRILVCSAPSSYNRMITWDKLDGFPNRSQENGWSNTPLSASTNAQLTWHPKASLVHWWS